MATKHEIKLHSTLRVFHIENKQKQLLCKVTVYDDEILGVFIDGELPEELEGLIRSWARKKGVRCPLIIVVMGAITTASNWMPQSR